MVRPPRPARGQTFTVQLTDQEADWVRAMATELGSSLSYVIGSAVAAAMADQIRARGPDPVSSPERGREDRRS